MTGDRRKLVANGKKTGEKNLVNELAGGNENKKKKIYQENRKVQ